MTNTKLLKDAIKRSGLKKRYLAAQIGLSPAGFYNCLNNKAEFRVSQVVTLCKELNITEPEEREAIFFASVGA